jgi:hypothetical protein
MVNDLVWDDVFNGGRRVLCLKLISANISFSICAAILSVSHWCSDKKNFEY